jgi:hypothetical protein
LHDAPLLTAAAASCGMAVQWCLVYICEAHASDTWPLKFSTEQPTPASLPQRAAYARTCADALGFASAGFRLCVDGMDDAFNGALGAWPTCYYVVDADAKLLHIGECDEGEAGYDVRRLISFVRRRARAAQGPAKRRRQPRGEEGEDGAS